MLSRSQTLMPHLEQFLSSIFFLANDEDPDVRKNVCHSFVMLLEIKPDILMQHIDGVIEVLSPFFKVL